MTALPAGWSPSTSARALGFAGRVVGQQVELAEPEVGLASKQFVEPVARRVHLEPKAAVRRDERPAPSVILHPKLELRGAVERGLEVVLVERQPEMVDARQLPLAGLHDDVHAAALELGETQLEPDPVELLPGGAGLERRQVVRDPPVARDQVEAELAEVASLDLPHLARDEVVVEEVHRSGRF